VLFRGRGRKRCLAEGRETFEIWVGKAVLANNLLKIAALLRSGRLAKEELPTVAGFQRDGTSNKDRASWMTAGSSKESSERSLVAELTIPTAGRYPSLDLTPQKRKRNSQGFDGQSYMD
jgi:hypothetical protein